MAIKPVSAKIPSNSLPTERASVLSGIEKRWTKTLVSDGWTPISNFFLDYYARLKPPLSTPEAMFVIQLMKHKWDEKHPRPSLKRVARRMGVSDTAVRNHARNLEKKKYLKRIMRTGLPNKFDLSNLFQALEVKYIEKKKRDEERAQADDIPIEE